MDSLRSLSCSMILEVLANLCHGPQSFTQLSTSCGLQSDYLRTVTASAVSAGLIESQSGMFQLTKKGARTAIYLLAVNEWMDFSTKEYQELMHALDSRLQADAPVA